MTESGPRISVFLNGSTFSYQAIKIYHELTGKTFEEAAADILANSRSGGRIFLGKFTLQETIALEEQFEPTPLTVVYADPLTLLAEQADASFISVHTGPEE